MANPSILTPSGYKDISTCVAGDQVSAFDLVTGAPIVNTIEKIEWIAKEDYQACNAPQGYNDGEEPPTLKPEDIPFKFYTINGKWTIFQDQSVWYLRIPNAVANVCHASDLQVGDTIFDGSDKETIITSISVADGIGWYRFAIDGDHSYIVDDFTFHNASRFWVGGGSSQSWTATTNTNFSASSGGANNATAPGASDFVFFDTNTGAAAANLNTNVTCQGIDFNGYTGVFTHAAAATFSINTGSSTSLRFSAGMTYTPAATTCIFQFTHTSGTATLTSNGKAFFALTINGAGGTTVLADALFVNAGQNAVLTLTSGTLDAFTNVVPITAIIISGTGATTRTLSLGGLVKLGGGNSGSNIIIWNFSTVTGLTFNKNSANMEVIVGSNYGFGVIFSGGGLVYNTLTLDALNYSGNFVLNQGCTFNAVNKGLGWSIQISGTVVISTAFTWAGTQALPFCLTTVNNSQSTQFLSCPSGTCTVSWCCLNSVSTTGGASFVAKNVLNCNSLQSSWQIQSYLGSGALSTEVIGQRAIKSGATSQSIDVFVQDASQTAGGGLTGLVYNASGLTAYYRKGPTGASTQLVLATQTATGAYSSGGLAEIDSVNMPGMYRLDIPDTVQASAPNATIYLQGAANMVPVIIELEIVGYDPTNATTLGLSGLATASALTTAQTSLTALQTGVTVTTNNDKTGYSLTQLFPSNFGSLGISAGGHVSNVDTLTTYTGNTVQTGDAYARIGAAGAGLTALGDTRIGHLNADIDSRMATFTLPTHFSSLAIDVSGNVTFGNTSIATVTNLTNAPTSGDLTAAMKTSVTTAATAATPNAVNVTGDVIGNVQGSVASVSGNIGGHLAGNVLGDVNGNIGGVVNGSVGSVVGLDPTLIDIAISTRLPTSSYTAPDNADIAAINSRLPAAPADESLIIAATNSIASAISALPTAVDNRNEMDSFSTRLSDIDTVVNNLPPFVHTSGKLWVLDSSGNDVATASDQSTINGNVDTILTNLAAIDFPTTGDIATAIAGIAVEDGLDLVQSLRLMAAVLAGVSSRSGSTSTFANAVENSKVRVTADVTPAGRDSVTFDLS